METIENKTFQNEPVAVEGKAFNACVFNGATLIFSGGEMPSFTNCRFADVSLQFEDAAENTLKFLSGLRGGGFGPAVDSIANNIRQGKI